MIEAHIAGFVARTPQVTGDARYGALENLWAELDMLDTEPQDMFAACVAVNQRICAPPLPLDSRRVETAKIALAGGTKWLDAEEKAVAQPATDFLMPAPKPRQAFTVERAVDFTLSDLPDFLVDGAILQGSVHAFYGPTQAGKTFAALDMAMRIATGMPWFDRPTLPAAVLWVAAEDAFGVKLRAMAWMKHHGMTGVDVPFRVIKDGLFNLRQNETVEAITEAAKALLAESNMAHVLVVIDTLSRSAPGADEISGKDTGEVIAAFDRIRNALPATVAVIHHSGKNEESGLRGHSSLGQGVDSYTRVKRNGIGHTLEFEKVKNAKVPAPIGFALEVVVVGQYPNGKIIDSCVVIPRDTKPVETGPINLSGVAQTYRNVLATLVKDEGEKLPDALTGGEDIVGVAVKSWRTAVKAILHDGQRADTVGKAWRRTFGILVDLGAVRTCTINDTEFVFIVDTS